MNILLPTDFSENSRNAAVYAMHMFAGIPCTFHLLHVLPFKDITGSMDYLVTPFEVKEKFSQILDWLESVKINDNHSFTTTYRANYMIEVVRQQVLEKNIDLILMGTKGISNKDEAVIGKNTSDVMMKVKCPVLAISEKTPFRKLKNILFPTDYKVEYNSKMLSTLLNLTNISQSSIRVLELFNSESEPTIDQVSNRSFLQKSFAPNVPELETFYTIKKNDTAPVYRLNDQTDMIVMVAKNLNICHKFLKNHHAHQIPLINQLPLLILH